jgi:hypothetical protein
VRRAADGAVDTLGQRVVARRERPHVRAADDAAGRAGGAQRRVQREARAGVCAQRARIGRGEDDRSGRAVAVVERAVQELAADARGLGVGPHGEQREAPQVLAEDRQRDAGEPVSVLGDPAPARVGGEDAAQALVGGGREARRRRRLVQAPLELRERGDEHLVDARDVVLGHRAQNRHGVHDRALQSGR